MKICLVYNFAQHYRTSIFSLLDRTFDIDFVFGDKMDDVKKMDYSQLQHPVLEVKNVHLLGPIGYQKGVSRLAWKPYDTYVVLGEPFMLSTWYLLIFARMQGKKVYFWTHGWYGRENFAKKWIKRVFFGLSNGVLLYGNYARNLMIDNGLNADKLHVIYNSLNYDEQLRIRERISSGDIYRHHFGNDNPVLIMIGRLNNRKKLDMLLRAVALLKERGRRFNAVLVGDGEDRLMLADLAHGLGISEQVWMYGACYDEEQNARLIYNADMCVVPGDIGLTAMHSMMFGTPVITHDNFPQHGPEFESVCPGLTGCFFKSGSVEDMVQQIVNWFDHYSADRDTVRANCYHEIDSKWNPHQQINTLKQILL